jgi:hypothetical protein
MKQQRKMPNGRYTDDIDAWNEAWRAIAKPIEERTGWKLDTYGHDLALITTGGERLVLTVHQAVHLGKVFDTLEANLVEHLTEYAVGYSKGFQEGSARPQKLRLVEPDDEAKR